MSADPIRQDGEFHPDALDPMLAAIRQSLVEAGIGTAPAGWAEGQWAALAEFGENQVSIVQPDTSDAEIEGMIKKAMGRTHGLSLLVFTSSAKNPDASAPGPRVELDLEMQLFVSSRIRGKAARSVLTLLGALAKFYHHSQIRISGFPWYEELRFTGFDPLPDPDFTAYEIHFTREFQL